MMHGHPRRCDWEVTTARRSDLCRPFPLEYEELAERIVVARPDVDHTEPPDHAERGEVPRERRRLDRGDAGLCERPVDARARRLDGKSIVPRRFLDRVRDLGDPIFGMTVEHAASDHARLVLE